MAENKSGGINTAVACIALAVSAVALYLVFDKEKAGKIFEGLKNRLKNLKPGDAPTGSGT